MLTPSDLRRLACMMSAKGGDLCWDDGNPIWLWRKSRQYLLFISSGRHFSSSVSFPFPPYFYILSWFPFLLFLFTFFHFATSLNQQKMTIQEHDPARQVHLLHAHLIVISTLKIVLTPTQTIVLPFMSQTWHINQCFCRSYTCTASPTSTPSPEDTSIVRFYLFLGPNPSSFNAQDNGPFLIAHHGLPSLIKILSPRFPSLKKDYVEEGNSTSPVILLIHGFPDLWYGWRHQIKFFANNGYRVIAIDCLGYGETVGSSFHNRYAWLLSLQRQLLTLYYPSFYSFFDNGVSRMHRRSWTCTVWRI